MTTIREEAFWMTPYSFWQPAHFPASAWIEHAPFAFWLTEVLRPGRVAELGTHNGYSCFVLAEAIRRLGLSSTVAALDTWQGDSHAGFYGDEVYASVRAVAQAEYPGIVELERGRFDQTRPRFEPRSVDLLHIDGRHGYEDVTDDYGQWRDTVRDGGVILFHDIAVRDRGFGVWRLWDELAPLHPSFTFEHGYGLGVLGVGSAFPPALQALFDATPETSARIRADYEALGAVVARTAQERRSAEDLDALLHSTSWRLTRPLRRAAETVRSWRS